MKCPICSVDLQMTDRQGIEIDYCPQCRGVWLDRGELDKLIERSATHDLERGQGRVPTQHRDRHEGYGEHRGRKKSLWREIFDFD